VSSGVTPAASGEPRRSVRTDACLADGRDLYYYDPPDTDRDPPPDRRQLPPQPPPGQARYDARTGEWVFVATHRQTRSFLPAADSCPLCPSTPGNLTEVPASDYRVAVFANRFPALVGQATGPIEPDGSLVPAVPAVGRCEVICFDPRHDVAFVDLDVDQVGIVIDAWADRTAALHERADVQQVFCFENRGAEIGVTQHHPHGQIYALPVVSPRTARMITLAARHRRSQGSNLFDDLLARELTDGTRVVTTNEHWVAFVPFAAKWPYELHVYPRRRVADLTGLDLAQRDSLASIYRDVLRRFSRLFPAPAPYVAAWHQRPHPRVPDANELALHLELFTNRRSATALKYLAGTEAGIDVFSNDVVPETAAQRLRELSEAT
jgi:UDPglucose--hexose-1-phosphate uridylyltransferase